MVDNPGSGPPSNAEFHAPLTSNETEGQGRDPQKHARYLHLHETYSTSKDPRGEHRYRRDGPPRLPPLKLERRHIKFIHGQLYIGKLAKRYGHTLTDECPLCHRPDSCTYIAGECKAHKNLSISRHNAACQLIHVALRNSAKGGGTLYSVDDLRLVAADAGNQNQTTEEKLSSLVTPPMGIFAPNKN